MCIYEEIEDGEELERPKGRRRFMRFGSPTDPRVQDERGDVPDMAQPEVKVYRLERDGAIFMRFTRV